MNKLTEKQVIEKNMASAMGINEANEFKAAARQFNYKNAMSLYGVLTDVETKASEYRRIEVLATEPYSSDDVSLLVRFFYIVKPAGTYTIWLYDNKTRLVTLGFSAC